MQARTPHSQTLQLAAAAIALILIAGTLATCLPAEDAGAFLCAAPIGIIGIPRLVMDQDKGPESGGGGGGGAPAGGGTTAATQTQGAPAQQPAGGDGANALAGLTPTQVQALLGPLVQGVTQQIAQAVKPITDKQAALEKTIADLSKPMMQAAQLWNIGGKAPGVIVGERPGQAEARGYQYFRVMGLRMNSPYMQAEKAKLELDIHQRLYKMYVEQGGLSLGGDDSILAPLGADMIACEDEAFAAEIRQCLGAGIRGGSADELRWMAQRVPALHQALSQFDDTALGVFTHDGTTGQFIDLLRAKEVFSRVGATQLTLPPNGRLPFHKQTGAMTAYWVGENEQITSSEPATGMIHLIAKKLAALGKLPNELVRFATPSVEMFLRNDATTVMALKADRDMIDGVGSTNAVKGLLRYAGVQLHVASTVAANGDTFEPEDVSLMLALLEEADHDLDTMVANWVMRPKMWHNILDRRAAAVASGDKEGPYLFSVNRNDITAGKPMMLRGNPVVRSTQVPQNRVKGSGTDLTTVILGVFQHWLIGRVGVMEFARTTSGDTAFQNDQTWVRLIQHLDAAPRYENAFVYVDDIDMDLPA